MGTGNSEGGGSSIVVPERVVEAMVLAASARAERRRRHVRRRRAARYFSSYVHTTLPNDRTFYIVRKARARRCSCACAAEAAVPIGAVTNARHADGVVGRQHFGELIKRLPSSPPSSPPKPSQTAHSRCARTRC